MAERDFANGGWTQSDWDIVLTDSETWGLLHGREDRQRQRVDDLIAGMRSITKNVKTEQSVEIWVRVTPRRDDVVPVRARPVDDEVKP
jgi:hypothetical protein